MLYYLLYSLHDHFSVFNVVRYITFRTAYASITALLLCLILGPPLIAWLNKFQIGQQIREDGPSGHQKKSGTPTMGGILILVSIAVPTLLWADLTNRYIWVALISLFLFGGIGFLDDYFKVAKKRSLGLTARQKIAMQVTFSLIIAFVLIWLSRAGLFSTKLSVPFFKNVTPDLNLIIIGVSTFIPLIIFVIVIIVGSSNAVNLSDGLDGLAAGLVVITATALTALTYVTGHATFAEYLGLIKNVYASELSIFCGSMAGAALGFLWYNCHP
ncbi:MAG: phospho-N-acetylmuramoyl-pentapeptide-transferase, partial [Anaerolineales bacterium]|nr:phospho-N-acetylmuramoyl-pentapeptide-transferase [Anaerolineales bacterium]